MWLYLSGFEPPKRIVVYSEISDSATPTDHDARPNGQPDPQATNSPASLSEMQYPLLIHIYSEGKSPQQPRWTNNRLPHWPKLCFLKAFFKLRSVVSNAGGFMCVLNTQANNEKLNPWFINAYLCLLLSFMHILKKRILLQALLFVHSVRLT